MLRLNQIEANLEITYLGRCTEDLSGWGQLRGLDVL
jgi:hypothetical protein